ncbi:hypothetical protein T484DRAFT_1850180 [Baffinella frigidus]|nr:hypothetical protein T484DRAFT_1850180 [Cryptophyta sp. CCMP2293]
MPDVTQASVLGLCFSRDGSLLLSASDDASSVLGMCFSRDGSLLLSASDDNTARAFSVAEKPLH